MRNHFSKILLLVSAAASLTASAQKVDYSVVSVNEESGLGLTLMSSASDYVCLPIVKRNSRGVNWLSNRILDVSKDGKKLAFVSAHGDATNIFIKDLEHTNVSVQRTNRHAVLDFSYSPDGKNIVFSEQVGDENQIFQTDANTGYVCRQITSGSKDYSPAFTSDMKQIFFARQEANNLSLWSYNVNEKYLSSLAPGFNPCPMPKGSAVLCTRSTADGRSEIWKINYQTGTEECIVSDPNKSFTTPSLSPNGKWILFVGTGRLPYNDRYYYNTDIYVCHPDGSSLTQLTYHAADDLSPVWSLNGTYIYFISQRGNADGTANIWRMRFLVEN